MRVYHSTIGAVTIYYWCPEPDSNRHASRRGILSMLSLGFPKAWTISLPSTLLGKAVGVQSWLLRGLNLPSSLYTFRQCIVGLARDRHFTGSPELTHSLLKHFCLRGTGFLVLPCVYHFTIRANSLWRPVLISGLGGADHESQLHDDMHTVILAVHRRVLSPGVSCRLVGTTGTNLHSDCVSACAVAIIKHTHYSHTPVPCKPLKYERMCLSMAPRFRPWDYSTVSSRP